MNNRDILSAALQALDGDRHAIGVLKDMCVDAGVEFASNRHCVYLGVMDRYTHVADQIENIVVAEFHTAPELRAYMLGLQRMYGVYCDILDEPRLVWGTDRSEIESIMLQESGEDDPNEDAGEAEED